MDEDENTDIRKMIFFLSYLLPIYFMCYYLLLSAIWICEWNGLKIKLNLDKIIDLVFLILELAIDNVRKKC